MNPPSPVSRRSSFLGLDFDSLNESGAAEAVLSLALGDTFAYVVTPNVDHLVRLHRRQNDAALWSAYRGATLCLCDSRVVLALARCSQLELSLVTGSDLTARLLCDGDLQSAAVIGGDARLLNDLAAKYPHLRFFHHIAPGGILHNPQAQVEVAKFVESCSAGVHFFAIGAPQSELICALIRQRGKAAGVGLCIGASLEFLTGFKRRAPRWMQKAGLEWLFRLASEPARLWRRYLLEGPAIFRIWWRWRLSSSR
jgi:exopolysaccharide biosynthesis WecB/TagA/CpsF family protein